MNVYLSSSSTRVPPSVTIRAHLANLNMWGHLESTNLKPDTYATVIGGSLTTTSSNLASHDSEWRQI